MRYLIPILFFLSVTGCASVSQTAHPDEFSDPFAVQDPIEPVNQGIFAFNLKADTYVMKPFASTYHYIPEWGRNGVANFLTNLTEPSNFVNGILQLDPRVTLTSFWRFMINTTFGFVGLRDFAATQGLKYQDQNFGKTLQRYGLASGPYLVVPLLGPSNVRNTSGEIVDLFIDPVGWLFTTPESVIQTVVSGISTRDADAAIIDQLYYQSLDPYVATRAAYLQNQAFQ